MMQDSVSFLVLAILVMGLYFYTVIVQPNRLRVEHHAVDLSLSSPLTVAVLADLRIGLYSGKPRHIRKLVSTINALSADAVMITGDWLYYPSADLVGQLMLFKGVNKPIYTVMSVSDLRYQSINTTKQGQPLLEDTLASAFDILDISYIGQQCTSLPLTCAATAKGHSVPSVSSYSRNSQKLTKKKAQKIILWSHCCAAGKIFLNQRLRLKLPVKQPKRRLLTRLLMPLSLLLF